ncbi:MAG: FecR domain-containing protein [Halobacteriovoraceae bacterium]|nr:FecR domain-containing protein [Halobacteriovoraceae bacterium]
MHTLLLSFLIVFSNSIFASDASVVLLKGEAFYEKSGKKEKLKQGSLVPEGAIVSTSKASVARLKLVDSSIITVGPNSNVEIKKMDKKGPGVLNLLQGKIRANVEKESTGEKTKLYITTKTAAMGVRGTEFQATFNPKNSITGLLTFRGEVVMSKVQNISLLKNITTIESAFKNEFAVRVQKGQFSKAEVDREKPVRPVRIAPKQFASMQKNETLLTTTPDFKVGAQHEHRIAGIPDSIIETNHEFLKEELIKSNFVQNDQIALVEKDLKDHDFKAEDFDVMPGGMITENGYYVAPIPGQSKFDPIANVYVPDESLGQIDFRTGEYIPPRGYELIDSGEFIVKDPQLIEKNEFIRPPKLLLGSFEYNEFEKMAYYDPNFDPKYDPVLEQYIEQYLDEQKEEVENQTSLPPPSADNRVRFRVTIIP